MDAVALDSSKWPTLVVRVTRPPTDAQLDEFLAKYQQLLQSRADPYAVVLDLRGVNDMPPAQRKRLTSSMRTNRTNERCRGCAMVFSSGALRLLLTAIWWIFKPKYPAEVFATDAEAIEWAFARLGDPVPLRRTASVDPGR
jgi:hypothetical protein